MEALHGADVAAALGGVGAPPAGAVEVPLLADLPPPSVVPVEGGEVLHRHLLPRLDVHPRPHVHHEGGRVDEVPGVAHAVVGHDREDGVAALAHLGRWS